MDTKVLTKTIMDKVDIIEDELLELLNLLEEDKVEEKYIVNVEEKQIKNLNSLLSYYDELSNNVDKINFYKFVLYVMKDEDLTNEFFQELKNLSLLTRTGLLDYAKEQSNYSKQVMSNFLLRLDKIQKDSQDDLLNNQIKSVEEDLRIAKKYKNYYAPIGIVKEVEDSKEFSKFLDIIKLNSKDKTNALFMALSFNTSLHDEYLSMYELDLQKSTDVIKRHLEVENITKIKKATSKKISSIVDKTIHTKKTPKRKKKVKSPKVPEEPIILQKLDNEEDYLEKYALLEKELLKNLTDITKTDLNETLNVIEKNSDLREEVYQTTENIERLLAYEINKIFDSTDEEEVVDRLKPVVDYIDKNFQEKTKKK